MKNQLNIKRKCVQNPTVQVFVADGLSSTAIEANIEDCLPALLNGLNLMEFQ